MSTKSNQTKNNKNLGEDCLQVIDDWFNSDQNQLGMDLTEAIEDGSLWHLEFSSHNTRNSKGQREADLLDRHLSKNHMLFRHRFHLSLGQDVALRNGVDEKPYTPVRTYEHYINWCQWYFGAKDKAFIEYRRRVFKLNNKQ